MQVENVRVVLSIIASIYYENPDESLLLVGITGTNGKTTVSNIAKCLLK